VSITEDSIDQEIVFETADQSRELLKPGVKVANRYEIVEALGQGGMGCVYLAKDTILDGERVALKILHREFSSNEQHTKRFLREVKLMHRVNHPNVVRTFDVGADGNLVHFTMEYIKATPLDVLIDSNAFPVQNTISIVSQICEGLEAIHDAGIVHRDLKPGNILLLEDGTVKITDFGVARPQSSDLTAHNEIVGSAAYVAPEIWEGDVIAPSVDLYSLGIIFYEIATGTIPFDAESPAALMRLHLDSEPVPPKVLNKDTPAWFNRLILKLLAKSPADRFETAGAIIDYVTQYESRGYIYSTGKKIEGSGPCVNLEFLFALEDIAEKSSEGDLSNIVLPRKEQFRKSTAKQKSRLKHVLAILKPALKRAVRIAANQLSFTLATLATIILFVALCSEFSGLFEFTRKDSGLYLLLAALPRAFAGTILLTLPLIILSTLSRSMLQVIRTIFIGTTFMLLAGSLLTIKLLQPVYQLDKTADISSILAAISGASEQLSAIAFLSPAISNYKTVISDQLLLVQWLNFQPIQSNLTELAIGLIYLGLAAIVAYRSMAVQSNLAKLSIFLVIPALLYSYASVPIAQGFEITMAPRDAFTFMQLPMARPAIASIICSWALLFFTTLVITQFAQRGNYKGQ